MKQNSFRPVHAVLLSLAIPAAFLLVVFTWQSLRLFLTRSTLDYFYPFLKASVVLEDAAAQGALAAGKSKAFLASALGKLQEELALLSSQNASLQHLKQENRHLRALLELRQVPGFRPVFAEIIARDPMTWDETFLVDKGAVNGIRNGDCVLAVYESSDGEGTVTAVAGRVTDVSDHTATISTVFHEDCLLSVFLAESGQFGSLRGTGGGEPPVISWLPADGRYGSGEVVLTGGLSPQIPAGLYVGTIREGKNGNVSQIVDHLYAEAKLKAGAKISDLRFVTILIREADTP